MAKQLKQATIDTAAMLQLHVQFNCELERIAVNQANELTGISESIELVRKYLHIIREMVFAGRFLNEEDEIRFFKDIKPLFSARLIYNIELRDIILRRHPDTEAQQTFLADEYHRIAASLNHCSDFYRYFKAGDDYLDQFYFVRSSSAKPGLPADYAEVDPGFSTGYDQLIARFRAGEMLLTHIAAQLEALKTIAAEPRSNVSDLKWTESQAALMELVVALDAHAVFNNAPVGIGKIASLLTGCFNIRIANVYRTYEEIRMRKRTRTPFLDSLKQSFERKMNYDDGR